MNLRAYLTALSEKISKNVVIHSQPFARINSKNLTTGFIHLFIFLNFGFINAQDYTVTLNSDPKTEQGVTFDLSGSATVAYGAYSMSTNGAKTATISVSQKIDVKSVYFSYGTNVQGASLEFYNGSTFVKSVTWGSNGSSKTVNASYIDRIIMREDGSSASGAGDLQNITFSISPASTAPEVTTTTPSSLGQSTATLGGNVTADGGATVTDRGVVYATSSNPTTSDTKVQISSGTGSFSQSITGLTASTTYYVRAYAINSAGTSYGSQKSFTTSAAAPTVTSVTVPANATYIAGQNLDFTVNFSDNVTVNTGGGTPRLAVTIGATTRQAVYQNGSGTGSLLFRYTVQTSDSDTDGIAVGTLAANGGTIRDGAGNDADLTLNSVGATASVLVDAVAPTVTSVTVPANATYISGQNLDFTLNFSENVTVNTGGGTPQLAITIGATARQAIYQSGSGTGFLLFRYTVQTSDSDTDGIAIGALASNGATIRDGASNDANLTLNSVGATASVLVDAVAPTVTSVTVPANATYISGQNIDFTVNFSENITVNTGSGTPQLAITIGATTRQAAYQSGSGSNSLLFRYTVQDGDSDADGITVGVLASNGGTIRDGAGNDANLTLNSVGATASVLVDAVAPAVTSVTVPANGTYISGQNMDFTVNFSDNATVNTTGGTPQLAITIGGTARQAIYQSGSGTGSLLFRYTVQTSDSDADGIAVGTLATNGGTIKDGSGNDADLTLNSVGATASVLVDAVAPTVTSVTVPANATYISGQNLDFTVNFSENVTVNTTGGTPQLAIVIGATTRQAVYQSGSGTGSLLFRYTVQDGDSDADGIAVGTFAANGGTIRDGAGNDADLTLNSVGATASVLVDAVAPTVSSVVLPANGTYVSGQNLDFTVNLSENVTVNTTGGTPQLAIVIGATTRQAVYQSGSGTGSLLFRYAVQDGDSDADGITVGALASNGGTIRDGAGNGADLTLNGVGSALSVFVDAVAPSVSSVTLTANGTYASGQNLDFTIDFSENVTVNTTGGTPQLAITIGSTTRQAVYQSGSGTGSLLFRYILQAGDSDADGITVGALASNGGTVSDGAGNGADLTLNGVGSALLIIVDAVAPVADVISLESVTAKCEVTTLIAPTATDNSGATVTVTKDIALPITTLGTTIVTWTYDDGNGNTSTQTQSIIVIPSSIETVTFTDQNFTYDGTPKNIAVEGLPLGASVTYTNNNQTEAGTYTVTAHIQPVSEACPTIDLTAVLTINKATQKITFNNLPTKSLEKSSDFQLDAIAESGLPIAYTYSFNSTNNAATVSATGFVNLLTSGTITITASQLGNSNYLQAEVVSQDLVITSMNASILSIIINGTVIQNPEETIEFTLDCSDNSDSISISYTTEENSSSDIATSFDISMEGPGIYRKTFTINSQDRTVVKTYNLAITKLFDFDQIIEQKFNNLLLVKNNPNTNGGYKFTDFVWYRNNQKVGKEQYYSEGDEATDLLDPNAVYYAEMTTESGDVLRTCPFNIQANVSAKVKLAPNPVQANATTTLFTDFDADELKDMTVSIYSPSGILIETLKADKAQFEIKLPANLQAGVYILACRTKRQTQTIQFIVK
ncbi:T9SS type A sorting domain-containing protein [Kriegella aquimaris]|uniref:Por secretion system C-terminal sorting domain-containing protein n=1 Tax=Kriegella aquimaris TaxID=192904 RepID=A0A1G9JMK4_9FLAO|nr:T9SS type A sorting domain-containing protein [Kriegella aquimaris]SDL38749.1 Por secretion system C-terminal sorting domain-containing protein [Kriegella aquimaris]